MLSILIFIGTALAVLLGIGAVIFVYAPHIVESIGKVFTFISELMAILPPWLLPFLLLALACGILAIIIKLL